VRRKYTQLKFKYVENILNTEPIKYKIYVTLKSIKYKIYAVGKRIRAVDPHTHFSSAYAKGMRE